MALPGNPKRGVRGVGRYEVVGRLGQGGMSTVYKAHAPTTRRLVALKLLKPRNEIFSELVGADKLKTIFLEEARIMGGISHPHIAKIIDCDEHDGMPFIVLEYFGHSIGSVIAESYRVENYSRPLSGKRVTFYLEQVLAGLERLHFAGIIHRDIKPYNLMITDDQRVKIIDFGLSRVRGEEKMAIPGMQVGSPYYTAPEQEKDPQQADIRADLYSAGVLAYRMLTGHLPKYQNGTLVPPSSLRPSIHGDWDAFVIKSLQKKRVERFVDAVEMLLALKEVEKSIEAHCPAICVQDTSVSHQPKGAVGNLRSKATSILYSSMRQELDLDGLMRPNKTYTRNFSPIGPLQVHHQATGLVWQTRGVGFALNWYEAHEYVEKLNSECWQGASDWRLPTVEELATILDIGGDAQVNQIFDSSIHWLWSADYCTKKQAWMADVWENYLDRLAKDSMAAVCAVRTMNGN